MGMCAVDTFGSEQGLIVNTQVALGVQNVWSVA